MDQLCGTIYFYNKFCFLFNSTLTAYHLGTVFESDASYYEPKERYSQVIAFCLNSGKCRCIETPSSKTPFQAVVVLFAQILLFDGLQ